MGATVIVGTQWGDEGKGKFTDLLARDMTTVVRFQGGHNAGHTIVVEGESFALQLVPSGVLYDHITPVIGNGVVVDLGVLLSEIAMLRIEGRRHLEARSQRQRSPDLPVPPAARRSAGAASREEQAGHDQTGHRPVVCRQVDAHRPARTGLLDEKIFRAKLEVVLHQLNPVMARVYNRCRSTSTRSRTRS